MSQSEAVVQQHIRLALGQVPGVQCWRNQVGAAEDKTGRVIRYGLMNDSRQLNQNFKSSDLVGIRPITITAEMVGQTVGVIYALEVKASDWKYRPNDAHSVAQLRFIQLVQASGGMGGFVRSVDEAKAVLRL